MRKGFYALLFTFLSGVLSAQIDTQADTNSVTHIVSDEVLKKRWERHVVLVDDNNNVIDKTGKVADVVRVEVASNLTARLGEISDAVVSGVNTALEDLYRVTNNIPEASYHFTLSFAPNLTVQNLIGYVVAEESDGVVDTQWVHYNYQMALAPNRYLCYHLPDGDAMIPCVWDNWTAAGITTNGYSGVHKCTATRPSGAVNKLCCSTKNETFGGPNGFDFGSMAVTVNNTPTFTGTVSNKVTGAILTFDNGVLK